ncbi:MAG TPA: peptidase M16, partial [Desulfobacteraceae bacterium]|nr:peptidase M16 [Desulfobacteraceae bacterium]
MTIIHGFRLIKEQEIAELNILARLFTHEKTCAELLSLSNDDENKVFGITFKTPPSDSTGAAHILEHSVLCGSRKYPVKEPFVELLKGSLQTFLNAFTYPDKTCYPVASQNVKDFYNLIDVYLDAVFYPRLTPHIFEQEGWHYELQNPNDPLSYKGVVFNEMKGAYSNPDSIAGEFAYRSLFPDNEYKYDSGGEPSAIPDLSYEEFVEFHKKYYHPSNCKIFLYGNISTERHLDFLEKNFLSEFAMQKNNITIKNQKRWSKPINLEKTYPVKETAGGAAKDGRGFKNKTTVLINWLTVSAT